MHTERLDTTSAAGAPATADTTDNRWMKIRDAARYAGGVNPQLLYREAATGRLRVARVGSGRNKLTCTRWVDQWLDGRASGGDR